MEYMQHIPEETVIIYDANQVISQWIDLITSGSLFIQGKRIVLDSQIIMELRDISSSSPSFIGNCQILYLGQHIFSKKQKLSFIIGSNNQHFRIINDVFEQLFGKHLENITDHNLSTLANLIKSSKETFTPKGLHKLLIWVLALIQNETLWNRYYSGKHGDYILNDNEIAFIDLNKYASVQHRKMPKYLLVPTRSTLLYGEFIR